MTTLEIDSIKKLGEFFEIKMGSELKLIKELDQRGIIELKNMAQPP